MLDNVKVVALDLDGTLTQHRTPIEDENKAVLDELSKRYKLLMVGAGVCHRIWHQLREYPIDIIGGYGMEYCVYDNSTHDLKTIFEETVPCNKDSVNERAAKLRKKYGYTDYKGDSVVFHPSGFVTFALLGSDADINDKLSFDPTKEKRRKMYKEVCDTFPEFCVMIGGSSSFDMTPEKYSKKNALDRYCNENGIDKNSLVYIGDDYMSGGNDESVYNSDYRFIVIDDYKNLRKILKGKLI